MDPEDLIIIDYPLLASSPPTPNPPLCTDDPFIKLNQAWERKVRTYKLFKKMFKECEGLRWINTTPVSSFLKV